MPVIQFPTDFNNRAIAVNVHPLGTSPVNVRQNPDATAPILTKIAPAGDTQAKIISPLNLTAAETVTMTLSNVVAVWLPIQIADVSGWVWQGVIAYSPVTAPPPAPTPSPMPLEWYKNLVEYLTGLQNKLLTQKEFILDTMKNIEPILQAVKSYIETQEQK